jgi:hypothetical protein
VGLPLGPFLDPSTKRRHLGGAKPLASARQVGHPARLVRIGDALDQGARGGIARANRDVARRQCRLGHLLAVEAQAGLTVVAVGAMARVAVRGEDRPYVLVEGEAGTGGLIAGPRSGHRNGGRGRRGFNRDPFAFRPGGPCFDPATQGLDLARGQRLGEPGHALRRIGVHDPLVEEALLRGAAGHRRARDPALAKALRRVEPKHSLGQSLRVAPHAGAGQDRLDVPRERGGIARGVRRLVLQGPKGQAGEDREGGKRRTQDPPAAVHARSMGENGGRCPGGPGEPSNSTRRTIIVRCVRSSSSPPSSPRSSAS